MNHITITEVGHSQIQTLVEYRILFALELLGEQPESKVHALKNQLTSFFSEALEKKSCISFIATYDGAIAGIGSVLLQDKPGNFKNPSGKWGYIMNMYTAPNYRRKGVCKGILNALLFAAKKNGVTAFELHATKEGEYVYLKNGFEIHHEPTYRKYLPGTF